MAARRLHQGLVEGGYDSRMLIQEPGAEEEDTRTLTLDLQIYGGRPSEQHLDELLEELYTFCRAPGVDVLFSTDRPTRDLLRHPWLDWADVIHLHWVARMVSAEDVAAMQRLGKPLVWTLHDQAPFTGGCHYSDSCLQYQMDCGDCPLLKPHVRSLPGLVLARKCHHIDPSSLTVVAPSRWLAAEAARSSVFRGADIRVIPYSLRVSDYRHLSRPAARARFDLPADAVVMMVGASSLTEVRKGYTHFEAVVERLSGDPAVGPLLTNGKVVCASFGSAAQSSTNLPIRHLGDLSSSDVWAAYRAADLFILPSLEDNLPNTMLEAVAAGTPVVGYATGGIPDVLVDGGCGVAVERGDAAALASAIACLVLDRSERTRLSAHCEVYADTYLSLDVQASAYGRLYREQITSRKGAPSKRRAHNEIDLSSLSTLTLISAASGLRAESESLRTTADQAARELRAALDEWKTTRETLDTVQQRMAGMSAESTALRHRTRRMIARGFPDPLATMSSWEPDPTALRVGIFGTGMAAMKVWEALAESDMAETVWFADNNPAQQRRAVLWIDVVAPADIPVRGFDAIVIGSMSGQPIREQLLGMNVDPHRILTPDVAGSVADIAEYLTSALGVLERERAAA